MTRAIMILGITGGLLNFVGSFYGFFLGDSAVLAIDNAGTLGNLCFAVIPLSILGVAGSLNVRRNPEYAGGLMVMSSLGVLFFWSLSTVIGSLLLVHGGVMAYLRGRSNKRRELRNITVAESFNRQSETL